MAASNGEHPTVEEHAAAAMAEIVAQANKEAAASASKVPEEIMRELVGAEPADGGQVPKNVTVNITHDSIIPIKDLRVGVDISDAIRRAARFAAGMPDNPLYFPETETGDEPPAKTICQLVDELPGEISRAMAAAIQEDAAETLERNRYGELSCRLCQLVENVVAIVRLMDGRRAG